ncbi:hypothetical protein MKP05_20480 [Halomonas sp. EGI 63088]|uniref:Transposase InsH N-terminal domain-containing protein n=1 Tax=Halomonas flagellata TaxID=2920385 RepID=A0ABS9S066_9GAMM|nr:hypothetical protein [Halomonas flagellata]MCH4565477.1 hypothetical protein [Halomonas flagellata]
MRRLDGRFPTSQGGRASDIVKAYLGLLCLGMSDCDAIENFRRDRPFQQLLNLQKIPSTATLRQRLEKLAANDLQARTAEWSTTLLSLVEAPITAYLGNEGWCLGLELRPGKRHTMKESNAFLDACCRVLTL